MRLPLFLLALAASSLSACKRNDPAAATVPAAPASAAAAVPVRVAAVEWSTDSPGVRAPAVLVRQTQAELSFSVGGFIEQLAVRAGDRVKQGQSLARLHGDTSEAQVAQARTAVEKARRDFERIEKLQAGRAATLENLQDARSQVDQSTAALRIAEFNRRHSVIVAPADGVILRRLAEPNEQVAAGRPVLTFAGNQDGWIAKAGLTTRDAMRVAPGAKVAAELNGQTFSGQIVRMAEAVDPATATIPVEAQFETVPAGARSGMTIALVITPQAVARRPVVPVAALREGRGRTASLVLVGGDGRAKRLDVEVEQVDGERAYLRTMLPAEASVVISGAQFVAEGGAVQVVKEQPAR